MIYRAKAPLRISFSGGGTDVPPYPEMRGGVVLSATIDKYAYTSLIPTKNENEIIAESLDYDIVAKYNLDSGIIYDGELDLVKATLKCMKVTGGIRLFIHSDAPPGTGLGSSSTMTVCLIGVIKEYLQKPMTPYEIADMAYFIERKELKISGGLQDQYAATFGGFNFIEFYKESVIVNPLKIDRRTLNELEYHLILAYTGGTRLSAKILDEQIKGYKEEKKDVMESLDELKRVTIEMKNALLTRKLDNFGELLHEGWLNKKKLASGISNPHIDDLYETARKNGALGGKLLGAGGGGYLLIYCPFEKKHIISRELEKKGAQVVKFNFELRGLQTWSIDRVHGK